MPTDPIEFSRTLANDDQQRCGNRVQLEDENAGAINAANPLPTTANIAGLADPLPVTLEDAAGNAAGVAGNPLQVGDAGGSITVDQAAHDNLNANVNLQVANTDVSAVNPVPVSTRAGTTLTVTIANGAAVSGEIDMHNYSMVIVHMPAAWTAARLAVQASPASGGTFQPLYDEDGNIICANGGANVAVNMSYVIPPSVAGARFIELWSENGAGADTNQGGDRVLTVDLKA